MGTASKTVLSLCVFAVFAWEARTAPLAMLVFDAAKQVAGKVPTGWELKVNAGTPDFSPVTDGADAGIRLRSAKSSFALERTVDADPAQLPFLTWRWKVTSLPRGGDFRKYSSDDEAAQLLVAFTDRKIVEYLWDSSAPQGTSQSASYIPLVHIWAIVCRSGTDELNRWILENRNVAADYQKAFGKPAPHVKGLRLQINSQHTGTSAESYFGAVEFRSSPAT